MHVERSYAVPPNVLFEVLTDPAYLAERNQRYGGVAEPTVDRGDDGVVISSPRQIPLEKLPSAAHRYLGDARITQIDRWTLPSEADSITGSLSADAGRIPIEVKGRHEIRSTGSGCRYAIDVTVKVTVPLVGRTMSGPVSSQLEKLLTSELRFTEDYLTSR